MDIIAHCRAAVKEPGSAFFIKRRAVFCQAPPRTDGHESGQDSTGFLHCGGTSGKVPINQTIHHLILIVCQRGKVRFTALVRLYFGTWPDNLRGSGVATERACRCRQASASKKIPQQNARKKRIFPKICLRRLQTGPKCGKMIHGYLMTTT